MEGRGDGFPDYLSGHTAWDWFYAGPQPGLKNSGYADLLHEHLSECLGTLLSDDPERTRERRGENGAIYVESRWLTPGGNACRDEGLRRLGTWADNMQHIDTAHAPLVANNEPISHVALVYSDLEPQAAEAGAAAVTMAMSLLSASHYAHIMGLLHMALADVHAMAGHPSDAGEQQPASLRPRKRMGLKLFCLINPNSGAPSNIEVADIRVNNVQNSVGGGLQAHNYWDNEKQFVGKLASIVQEVAGQQRLIAA